MHNILSEAAMDKLLTLTTKAQYHKAATALLVIVVGGASFYLLLPRRKPAANAENVLLIPEPPFLASEQPTTTSQPPTFLDSQQTSPLSRAPTGHIPTPINTLLTAVGLPGVETPKITPEDKIVKAAPKSYGALAPGGKGLGIHEEVAKQNVIDKAEMERVAGMEEKEVEDKHQKEGPGSSSGGQRAPSRLGKIRVEEVAQGGGNKFVAPEPEPVVNGEEVETDREDFESLNGDASTDKEELGSLAGDGGDVEMEDKKS